ncbi:MAG: hypothetical protein JKY88_05895 [Pseudomonadales bacterium]|nr:hypothetical protein [Pseudomonadales bacterium]
MHDTVWFEIQGLASVTIASSEFKEAAAIQAEALGMDNAKCVFVPHPIQDATIEQMQNKAEGIVSHVIAALKEALKEKP